MGDISFFPLVRSLGEGALIFLKRILGNLKRYMRNRKGEIKEKRIVLVLDDKIQSLLNHNIHRVQLTRIRSIRFLVKRVFVPGKSLVGEEIIIPFEDKFFSIPPQMGRVVIVSDSLAQVSVEKVKALFVGIARAARPSQTPFPDGTRGVAGPLEKGTDGLGVRKQRPLSF
jgi:hypothetical protein